MLVLVLVLVLVLGDATDTATCDGLWDAAAAVSPTTASSGTGEAACGGDDGSTDSSGTTDDSGDVGNEDDVGGSCWVRVGAASSPSSFGWAAAVYGTVKYSFVPEHVPSRPSPTPSRCPCRP